MAKQESNFQTRRIQCVGHKDSADRRGKWGFYSVIIRDVYATPYLWDSVFIRDNVTDETVFKGEWVSHTTSLKAYNAEQKELSERFSLGTFKPHVSLRLNSLGYGSRVFWSSKARAEHVAKEQSKVLDLPFDPRLDWIDEDDMTMGSVQVCVYCKKNIGRAFEPGLCADCKTKLKLGEDVLKSREPHYIETDLIDHVARGYDILSSILVEQFAVLVGSTLQSKDPDGQTVAAQVLSRTGVKTAGQYKKVIQMTQEQIDAAQTIVIAINKALTQTFEMARQRGESFIFGLAEGRMSVEQFNEQTTKKV